MPPRESIGYTDERRSTHTLVLSADFSITRSSSWRRHHFITGPVFQVHGLLAQESKTWALTRLSVPEFQVSVIGCAEELGACGVEADVSHSLTVT